MGPRSGTSRAGWHFTRAREGRKGKEPLGCVERSVEGVGCEQSETSEADGLALSSRNRYLSPEDRARAAALPRLMRGAIGNIESGTAVREALDSIRQGLLDAGFDSVDYVELADAGRLTPLAEVGTGPARLFVAARIGGTRLIDNMPLARKA